MADPYLSTNRFSRGELKFPTKLSPKLEKLYKTLQMFGIGPPQAAQTGPWESPAKKAQRKLEEVTKFLDPVSPDINPSSPKDIVEYHEKIIREKIIESMVEKDVLPEELDEVGVPFVPPRVPRRSIPFSDLSISAPDQ